MTVSYKSYRPKDKSLDEEEKKSKGPPKAIKHPNAKYNGSYYGKPGVPYHDPNNMV